MVDLFLKGGKKVKHLFLHLLAKVLEKKHANILPNGGENHNDFSMLDSVKSHETKTHPGVLERIWRSFLKVFGFLQVGFLGGSKNIFSVQRSEPPRNIPRTFHSKDGLIKTYGL